MEPIITYSTHPTPTWSSHPPSLTLLIPYSRQVREGASFLVLNRGKPAARIVPAEPREVLAWDDHLATAVTPVRGRSAEETVRADREGRW